MTKINKPIKTMVCILIFPFIFLPNIQAQETKKPGVIQEKAEKTKPKQEKKELASKEKEENLSELKQKIEYTPEKILRDAQSTFSQSLSILNIVVTILGVLVGLMTAIVVILGLLGFFEIKNWRKTRQDIETDAQVFKDLRNNLENEMAEVRKKANELLEVTLAEKPEKEIMDKLDDFGRKLELFESLGLPLNAIDYLTRGNNLFYQKKYSLALAAINKAIELKPDFAWAWTNKGVVLGELNRHEEALIAIKRAIELKPNDARTWTNKGVELSELNRHEEALTAQERAIELKPNYSRAWTNKGVALSELNRHEEALIAHKRAIELKPDYAVPWINIASIYSLKEDEEEALKHLAKAIELEPEYKKEAKTDEDFKDLWDNEEFKKITA